MTKLKIKITKEVLEKTKYCKENVTRNCAIAYAIRGIFPKALVGNRTIFIPEFGNRITLTREASCFVYDFDLATPEERAAMPELEFEVNVPDEIINSIDITELTSLLTNHPTLSLTK